MKLTQRALSPTAPHMPMHQLPQMDRRPSIQHPRPPRCLHPSLTPPPQPKHLLTLLPPHPASQLTIPPTPSHLSHYTEYSALPGCHRGFCNRCGSTILWRSDDSAGEVKIMTGTLDEDVLLGEWGAVLVRPVDGQFWCRNAMGGGMDWVGWGEMYEGGEGSRVVGRGGKDGCEDGF